MSEDTEDNVFLCPIQLLCHFPNPITSPSDRAALPAPASYKDHIHWALQISCVLVLYTHFPRCQDLIQQGNSVQGQNGCSIYPPTEEVSFSFHLLSIRHTKLQEPHQIHQPVLSNLLLISVIALIMEIVVNGYKEQLWLFCCFYLLFFLFSCLFLVVFCWAIFSDCLHVTCQFWHFSFFC